MCRGLDIWSTRHASNERCCLLGLIPLASIILVLCIELALYFWLREMTHMFIPGKCTTEQCTFNGKTACCCDIYYSSKPPNGEDLFSRNITACHFASSPSNCALKTNDVNACWLNPADNKLWYAEPRALALRVIIYLAVGAVLALITVLVFKYTHVVPDGLLPFSMQAELRFGYSTPPNDGYDVLVSDDEESQSSPESFMSGSPIDLDGLMYNLSPDADDSTPTTGSESSDSFSFIAQQSPPRL